MPELTAAQYSQLGIQINKMGVARLKDLFDNYTYQGAPLQLTNFPNLDAMRRQELEAYLNRPRPNNAEQQEWQNIASQLGRNDSTLITLLQAYIDRWSASAPVGNHLDEARAKIQEAMGAVEQQDWYDLDHFSMSALDGYMQKYPYTSHLDEIDDEYYNLASDTTSMNVNENLQRYLSHFPAGKHSLDANEAISAFSSWDDARQSNDLQTIHSYISQYPNSPFIDEAENLYWELKQRELDVMRSKFNEYSRDDLLYYINAGIFTEQELCAAGVATPASMGILRNYNEVVNMLPNLDEVCGRCKPECPENYTDVYMFGIPGTGKSCILTGLIGDESHLRYNSVLAGGPYADALYQFVNNGCPPPPTQVGYLTTIQAILKDNDENDHNVNLVEMAGEEFAFKIADNEQSHITFEDMGSGATQLLLNQNRKVFFIVIDLTKSLIRHTRLIERTDPNSVIYFDQVAFQVDQKKCIKRIVDIFGLPENKAVMNNVDGIHFIVTKSDMLDANPANRQEVAKQLFLEKYGSIVETLAATCKEYGINASTNGRPKLYTFSLGKFYVGNVYDYDPTDSTILLNAIKGYTRATRKTGIIDRVKKFFN